MLVTRLFSRSVLMLFVIGILMSTGCSSSKQSSKVVTATSRVNEGYERAQKLYEKEDYTEATNNA